MSRREFLKALAAGSAAWALGTIGPGAARGAAAKLRFSTWHPPIGKEVQTVWAPMLEELKRASEGNLDYTLYAGAALGKGPEHFDIVARGLSDMGYFTATWTPGRFPLTDVLSLAAWVDGKDVAAEIGNAVYRRVLTDEFAKVKLLELNGCIQSFIWTRKPVSRMGDLAGIKLRSPGGHQTNYIKALGAEPVFMPLGDVYMAMETGTVDGIVTCPPLILGYKLHEVVRHAAVLTLGCVSEGVAMNLNVWNRLSAAQKTALEQVCSNPYRTTGGLSRSAYGGMMGEIARSGVELNELPAAEADQWYRRFQEVTRVWVREMESKGLPAGRAVAVMNEECERRGVRLVACPDELKRG
jgi:TRAP-type C4-dicarboxylate transport system substrate-binding protein